MVDDAAGSLNFLKEETLHIVLCRWKLEDMLEGLLLKRIIEAKPSMLTMALVEAGNLQQGIAAQTLGVSVVLSEDVGPEVFRYAVCELVGIEKAFKWF